MRSRQWCALVVALAGGCGGGSAEALGDGCLALPEILQEVSGVVAVDTRTVACVQDENGAIVYVDIDGGRPPRVVRFGDAGDYEGLAFTGSDLWVLRSDGVLLRLLAGGERLHVVASFRLPSGCEYEGLCFDARGHRLLVLPKGPMSDKKRERDRRHVLAFDLDRELVLAEPVLTLELDELRDQAKAGGFALPTRRTSKGKKRTVLELMGSEIAVDPDNGDFLLLSAAEPLVIRVGRDGRLRGTRLLSSDRLPQPEAMTFLPDGRFIVASEGRRQLAQLCVIESP